MKGRTMGRFALILFAALGALLVAVGEWWMHTAGSADEAVGGAFPVLLGLLILAAVVLVLLVRLLLAVWGRQR